VGIHEIRKEKRNTVRAEDYSLFSGGENANHQLGTGLLVHKEIIIALRRVEFVSDRMSYILLSGRWCNIIVLNVHASCENKSDIKTASVWN
jgi:hypothetical protein